MQTVEKTRLECAAWPISAIRGRDMPPLLRRQLCQAVGESWEMGGKGGAGGRRPFRAGWPHWRDFSRVPTVRVMWGWEAMRGKRGTFLSRPQITLLPPAIKRVRLHMF